MEEITTKEQYYVALDKAKELEDLIRMEFPNLENLGLYLKELSKFDIMSARELARQILNLMGENYPAINNITQYKNLNSPESQEDMKTLKMQLAIKETFANRG